MMSIKEKENTFSFNAENMIKAESFVKKYPLSKQRSAILPLLTLAQEQAGGWLPLNAIEYVADFLGLPFMRAHEVASFYTMFNLKKVGKYHIQVCGTTPCWLRGADKIMAECEKQLGIRCGEMTSDGKFSISEVECLGACVNAPIVQVNNQNYYEDLSPEIMADLINKMKNDQLLLKGSQIGRTSSEPKQ